MEFQAAACDGVIIVHVDRTITCTNPDCDVVDSVLDLFDRHCWFIPCAETLGSRCPTCRSLSDQPKLHAFVRPDPEAELHAEILGG
jgi:hypothetical protein